MGLRKYLQVRQTTFRSGAADVNMCIRSALMPVTLQETEGRQQGSSQQPDAKQ